MPITRHHGLEAGAFLSGPLFPLVLSEWDMGALSAPFQGSVPPDQELAVQAFSQLTMVERVQI